jgi:vesicle coat complex subunit
MTPKEKADQLFNKMDMIIYTDQDHDSQCKRCALIAVDEIINLVKHIDVDSEDYWEEVKQEIQQL